MHELEERALAKGLARLDEQAWLRLCRELGPMLRRYVQVCFGCDTGMAEEITQMAFIRCIRSIATFDPSRGGLCPWLKTIALNEGRTLLRKRHHTATAFSSLPEEAALAILDVLDTAPLPDAVLDREDVQLAVHEVLVELGTRYREALVLKYLEQRTVAEMATALDTTEKAVESLLSRARAAFRQAFVLRLKQSGSSAREVSL